MKKEQTTRKLPTQLTGQGQVLLQQAGPGHNIHSETVALRILGFVPGLESVDVDRYASLGELQLHATGAWKVLAREPFRDPSEELEVVTETLRGYTDMLARRKVEFEARVARGREGGDTIDTEPVGEPEGEPAREPMREPTGEPITTEPTRGQGGTGHCADVVSDQELRGQQFAVIAIIQGDDKDPIVCPLGAMKTQQECTTWIEHTLSDKYPSLDMFCVDMYEWIHPHLVRERVPRADIPFTYRNPQITDMMKYHLDEETKMEKFQDDMVVKGIQETEYIQEVAG